MATDPTVLFALSPSQCQAGQDHAPTPAGTGIVELMSEDA